MKGFCLRVYSLLPGKVHISVSTYSKRHEVVYKILNTRYHERFGLYSYANDGTSSFVHCSLQLNDSE
jgi:hypothetical protein